MRRYCKYIVIAAAMIASAFSSCRTAAFSGKSGIAVDRPARIYPDYADILIPPNMAPLNFRVKETGDAAVVIVRAPSGEELRVTSRDGKIRFPLKKWKRLLAANRGKELLFEVFVRENGRWKSYQPIRNRVAEEPIDAYLVYRLINPAYKYWNKMGLYQRNLETFEEKPILINRMTDGNCMNCHNFCANDPHKMVFHMRTGTAGGTYIFTDNRWRKVSLKTSFNKGGAYPSWHPNGRTIAFSVNDLTMFYHAVGDPRDVLDRNSDLVVYHIDKNMISAAPQIADEYRMETFPAWSADGKKLYFCSARAFESYLDETGDLRWNEIRYNLMRVAYDADRDEWGELETVVDAEKMGKSVIIPRPSPDGKYVMFCLSDYGSFPIYHRQSDLYLYEEATGRIYPLPINSDETDSFHSWSSNSRWFVFTSKRYDTLLGKPYFAHIDAEGNISKPFVLPQRDPDFYKHFIINYNVPELAKGEVQQRLHDLRRVAYGKELIQATLDPRVDARRQSKGSDPEAMYNQAKKKK
ncbi:MAG: hypothetical protein ONB12_06730 [candidate division KSB1 bacterium]|nr:hypothetical protein [candidate division KSB1 bacterium]